MARLTSYLDHGITFYFCQGYDVVHVVDDLMRALSQIAEIDSFLEKFTKLLHFVPQKRKSHLPFATDLAISVCLFHKNSIKLVQCSFVVNSCRLVLCLKSWRLGCNQLVESVQGIWYSVAVLLSRLNNRLGKIFDYQTCDLFAFESRSSYIKSCKAR